MFDSIKWSKLRWFKYCKYFVDGFFPLNMIFEYFIGPIYIYEIKTDIELLLSFFSVLKNKTSFEHIFVLQCKCYIVITTNIDICSIYLLGTSVHYKSIDLQRDFFLNIYFDKWIRYCRGVCESISGH